jgi:hypothetical protein
VQLPLFPDARIGATTQGLDIRYVVNQLHAWQRRMAL